MPEKRTIKRARKDKRAGKATTTQAGEFVREEMHHIREGKHGARSAKQAIAIGLSKARRAGVPLRGQHGETPKPAKGRPSKTRSRAMLRKLKGEGHSAASHRALSRQAHSAAARRTHKERSASARKAARTRSH